MSNSLMFPEVQKLERYLVLDMNVLNSFPDIFTSSYCVYICKNTFRSEPSLKVKIVNYIYLFLPFLHH